MEPHDVAHEAFAGTRAGASGAFAGARGADALESEIERRWRHGDYLHHLGPHAVPALPPARQRLASYGLHTGLTTDVLFGEPGAPGCLLIGTPPQPSLDESLRSFFVPPHVHASHHVSLVTSGAARFLVVRTTRAGRVLVDEPVTRGTLILIPADAPHTFITRHGFEVASLHTRWLGADRTDFARDCDLDVSVLPRVRFEAPGPKARVEAGAGGLG